MSRSENLSGREAEFNHMDSGISILIITALYVPDGERIGLGGTS
jgi:hypothetical protein